VLETLQKLEAQWEIDWENTKGIETEEGTRLSRKVLTEIFTFQEEKKGEGGGEQEKGKAVR